MQGVVLSLLSTLFISLSSILSRLDSFREHQDDKTYDGPISFALLDAMQHWVAENGAQAEEFSAWVAERAEIAGQTKSISQLKDADW